MRKTNNSCGRSKKKYIHIPRDVIEKVGKKIKYTKKTMKKQKKTVIKKRLEFCSIIAHKDIYKYTRKMISRREKLIIDYILIEKKHRNKVLVTKVRRISKIGSDHYLVIAKMREIRKNYTKMTKRAKQKYEIRKSHKLIKKDIAKRYEAAVTKKFNKDATKAKNSKIKTLWNDFKTIILKTTEKVCGSSTRNNYKRQTAW